MNKTLSNLLKFVLFAGIGTTILYLVYVQQDHAFREQCRLDGIPDNQCSLLHKILSDFNTVHYSWIATVLAAFFISNVLRALRWLMLIRPLGYQPTFSNALLSVLISYFANLGLPRMGEVVRAGTLSRYARIPFEKLMGTIVTDRLVDMLTLLTIVALAFLVEFNTLWTYLSHSMQPAGGGSSRLTVLLAIMAFAGLLAAAVGWYFRERIRRHPAYLKVVSIAMGFWEGIQSIRRLQSPVLFIAYSLGIWAMYFYMNYACLMSFPPTHHLGLEAALMSFVFGTFGMVIPSPGGMGTYHALIIASLALYRINGNDAFSLANIAFFSVQIFSNILLGILSLILLPMLNTAKNDTPPDARETA